MEQPKTHLRLLFHKQIRTFGQKWFIHLLDVLVRKFRVAK